MAKNGLKKDSSLDISPKEAHGEGINFSEISSFISKARSLIERAEQNDGKIDVQEAADIFRVLMPELERISGEKVRGKILYVKRRYESLINVINRSPAISTFFHDKYPSFFRLFSPTSSTVAPEAVPETAVPDAAANPDAAVSPDASAPGSDTAGDRKKERPEMSAGQIDKLRAFIAHDFGGLPDAYGEAELIEIAQILATARSKRRRMPVGLSQKARELFASCMFGMSPEQALERKKESAEGSELIKKHNTLDVAADRTVNDEAGRRPHGDGVRVPNNLKATAPEAPAPEAAPVPERREISSDDQKKLLDFADTVRQYKALLEDLKAGTEGELKFSEEMLNTLQSDVDRVRKVLDGEVLEIARILVRVRRTNESMPVGSRISLDDVVLAFQSFIEQNISPQEFIDRQEAPNETGSELVNVDRERDLAAPHSELWDELPSSGEALPRPVVPVRRNLPPPSALPRASQRPPVFSGERREMGVVVLPTVESPAPDATELPASSSAQVSSVPQESVFGRMRGWTKQKFGELENSDVYRVHMKGEKTHAEMEGLAPTLSRPAMITGAILSAVLSYSGKALLVDLPRYIGQRYYTRVERDEILTAFQASVEARRRRESTLLGGADVSERNDALYDRVFASRYLTIPEKQNLFYKLRAQENTFATMTSPDDARLKREAGRILENLIRTRISEEKVLKEATNTLFMVSGANFLRAPAYGAISLYERWSRLTRETPESKAGDRLRATVAGGFDEYWDKVKGKKGRLAQAAAVGTAFRFVGMSATLVESVASSGIVGDLLRAWEHKEAAYPSDATDLSHQSIDEIIERVRQAKAESWTNIFPDILADRRVEIPEPSASIQPDHAPDVGEGTPNIVDDDFEPVPGGDSVPGEAVPDVDVLPDPEVVMSPDRIPTEALVGIDGAHNGITQALLSAVEARPDLLRGAERAALGDDYTAALLMRRMAAKDGLLDYWISAKAVGKLAIVPKYEADGAHIVFLNPETGTAYSLEELKDLGWLVKARK